MSCPVDETNDYPLSNVFVITKRTGNFGRMVFRGRGMPRPNNEESFIVADWLDVQIVMKKESVKQTNRQSVRLKDADYTQNGLYFVTICSHKKVCVFGKVVKDVMTLNPLGRIIEQYWEQIPQHFPNAIIHEYVVMPNHMHGIIAIDDIANDKPPTEYFKTDGKTQPKSLGAIVGAFKSAVSRHVNQQNVSSKKVFWQRNYYEHIIRDEEDYYRVRQYILDNPVMWATDEENPLYISKDGYVRKKIATRARQASPLQRGANEIVEGEK